MEIGVIEAIPEKGGIPIKDLAAKCGAEEAIISTSRHSDIILLSPNRPKFA